MRINDLLFEAGLKPADFTVKNNHYWANFLELLKNNAEIELTNGSKARVANAPTEYKNLMSIWDGSSLATPDQVKSIKNYKLPLEDGSAVPLSKVYKSDFIKTGTAPSAGEEEGGKFVKFWNLGNVVEGVMGAAVTAKFINPEKQIEWKDIVSILKQMSPGASTMGEKGKVGPLIPYSMNSQARNDKINFVMSLNSVDFKALQMSYQDANTLQKYPKHEEIFKAYTDAAEYVNTADTVKTAIDRVMSDPNENTIIIESEGATKEKQTSTKADLFITIDNKRERLLSLKSKKVPQVGQVSGHAFENLEEFFKSTLGFGLPSSFSQMFPKGSFSQVGPQIFEKAFPTAYKHMFDSLSQTLNGSNDYKEYDFVKQIYSAIQHHATLGEDVIIVYLSPGANRAYTELKIGPELFNALKEFDLYPVLASPTTLKVMGKPVTEIGKQITGGQPQEFCQLRSYMQKGSTIRNIIELKSLLKSLADVENIKKRTITAPAKQPDELSNIKKNAGINPKTAPVKKLAPERTPPQPQPAPQDELRFSSE